jgi:S-adenosylmethionine:tRNA ribosyltransferase-isomerase
VFRDFPQLLRPDDLLVFNNTKVLPARLWGHRSGSRAQRLSMQNPATKDFLRGRVEVLLTRQLSANPPEWEALVHPGRKLGLGERIYFGGEADESSHELAAEIVGRGTFGERHLRFDPVDDFFGVLNRIGHIPLPPYIDRPDTPSDRESYQTIYAKPLGSVAAPTAGLHFTPEILERIRERGIETVEVTLHVGLGTFQPVREEVVEEHKLHREQYEISADAAQRIQRARDAGRRIVAVGTTTVRTLEFAARQSADGRITAQTGQADIFIYPGFEFRVVGAMLTTFHVPKSTLLMLVSAFAGRERTLQAYEHAVRQRYRFYSYGNCMFVE